MLPSTFNGFGLDVVDEAVGVSHDLSHVGVRALVLKVDLGEGVAESAEGLCADWEVGVLNVGGFGFDCGRHGFHIIQQQERAVCSHALADARKAGLVGSTGCADHARLSSTLTLQRGLCRTREIRSVKCIIRLGLELLR